MKLLSLLQSLTFHIFLPGETLPLAKILQAIKNWRHRRPGNEARYIGIAWCAASNFQYCDLISRGNCTVRAHVRIVSKFDISSMLCM